MQKLFSIFAMAVLLLVGGCLSCNRAGGSDREENGEQLGNTFFNDSTGREDVITKTLYAKADSILEGMTIEEKAAQTIMPAIFASDDFYSLKVIGEYGRMGVGGIVLLKGDSKSAKSLSDSLVRGEQIPPFIAIDAEWGLAMRLTDTRRFPTNSELADTVGEEEMFLYGAELARECKEIGINMVLGPVVDVAAQGSYMRRRSFGADPERVSDLAVAYARGLESGGVVSVAKHFPGHGSVSGDSHKNKPVISRSLHEMDSIDLYPFRRYIEEGLSAIMVGHLALPAIDSAMQPAAVSRNIITGLLIEDLGFNGLVLTDALNMGGAEGKGADKAILAGADIVLVPKDTRKAVEEIVAAVNERELSEEILDKAVRKIIFFKLLKTG